MGCLGYQDTMWLWVQKVDAGSGHSSMPVGTPEHFGMKVVSCVTALKQVWLVSGSVWPCMHYRLGLYYCVDTIWIVSV